MKDFFNLYIKMKTVDSTKELEQITLKALATKYKNLPKRSTELRTILKKVKKEKWSLKNKVLPINNKTDVKNSTSLVDLFRNSTKMLFFFGTLLGLCPVMGVFNKDISKIRFSYFNWRTIISVIIGLSQGIVAALHTYRFFKYSISLKTVGFMAFNMSTCATTFLMIKVSSMYPKMLQLISDSSLNAYVDQKVKLKCNIACFIVFSMSVLEHAMSTLARVVHIYDCTTPESNRLLEFFYRSNPYLRELGEPPYFIGIYLQILNVISAINWNYSDIYLICISMFLESILKDVNKAIVVTAKKDSSTPEQWRLLREDYNRASRLVRSFDDVISGVVFLSLATNLFFICYQLFNVLSTGIGSKPQHLDELCDSSTSSGPLSGNEYTIYLVLSITYLILRWQAVIQMTASVNSAAMLPAITLYDLPSISFCNEVSRLLDQIHTNTVALSGLQFFYVTKHLVLPVAGTIITYELVLLQFNRI